MNFELLNNLIKEYVFIVDALKENVSEDIMNKENKIYLNRETFEKLLSKNMFISLEKKKYFWRNNGWIFCDKDPFRFTKVIRIGDKTYRKVVIDLTPYVAIKTALNNW